MRHTHTIIGGALVAAIALPSVAALAKAGKLTPVGTLTQVAGVVRDRHPNAKRAVLARNGATVYAGDTITLGKAGTARVSFKPAATRQAGALFTLQAAHADSQEITRGVPKSGPRIAFRYDGHYIYTVSGRGIDAPARIAGLSLKGKTLRFRLTATSALDPTFACRIDEHPYRRCGSRNVFNLSVGTHTISAQTTSLFGFHGPSTTKRIVVKR